MSKKGYTWYEGYVASKISTREPEVETQSPRKVRHPELKDDLPENAYVDVHGVVHLPAKWQP